MTLWLFCSTMFVQNTMYEGQQNPISKYMSIVDIVLKRKYILPKFVAGIVEKTNGKKQGKTKVRVKK